MGIYIDAVCQSLPGWILGLAVIGGIVLYGIVGFLIYQIIKAFKEDLDSELVVLFIIFWPIIIVGGIAVAILYYVVGYIFKFFAYPIVGVDKADLRESEDRIIDKIDAKIDREDNKIMNYLESEYVPPKPVEPKKSAKDKAKASKKKKGKK